MQIENQKLLTEENAFVYLNKLPLFINQEVERTSQYLDKLTEERIVRVLKG